MRIPTLALTGKKLSSIEEGKRLYAGKTFFIKRPDGTLDGPRDDIYYSVRYYSNIRERFKALYHKLTGVKPYAFVQITNGIPKQAFTADQIVVKQDGK
jgi:hypothetical protein